MSLETLLQAAEFVESSSGPNKKENSSNPRGNVSSNVLLDRRRVVSESDATERRRRPGGAGTRETHNKLEKNRRAHLKECFDILKKQVPTLEEKKTSNLNILRSALKYIQTMKKQEQDYVTECAILRVDNKNLLQRLSTLKKPGEKEPSSLSTSTIGSSTANHLKKPNALPMSTVSQILPISVATQTSPNIDKEGESISTGNVLEEIGRTTHVSTSSTDSAVEGEDSDRKISLCEDERTDTDEELNNNDEDDNEQDIEIDVVGQDDSSNDSLRLTIENDEPKVNGKVMKPSNENSGKSASNFTRKRSKSEMKCEEDSDYDENTKEEPKKKIQACARVSV